MEQVKHAEQAVDAGQKITIPHICAVCGLLSMIVLAAVIFGLPAGLCIVTSMARTLKRLKSLVKCGGALLPRQVQQAYKSQMARASAEAKKVPSSMHMKFQDQVDVFRTLKAFL